MAKARGQRLPLEPSRLCHLPPLTGFSLLSAAGGLLAVQRLGLCPLLAVPWKQVLHAGKPIPGVVPGAALPGVRRERAAALPAVRGLSWGHWGWGSWGHIWGVWGSWGHSWGC